METQQQPATDSIRIAGMDRDERRMILLLTPQERKAALLDAARRLLAQISMRQTA